jgi:hypothetical protein
LPRRRAKPQWTEPIILVPIIAAVITAIVSPIVVPIIQDLLKQWPKPPDDGHNGAAALTVTTDKKVYGLGDLVRVSGNLDEPVQGKTVRLDVYDPKGKVFEPFNATFATGDREDWTPAFPRLSDVQVKPNDKGLFSYLFPVDKPVFGPFIKGTYKIEVSYGNMTRNATFTVR